MSGALRERLAARLRDAAGAPAPWAAAYDPGAPGPHPIVMFVSWAGPARWSHRGVDDLGQLLEGSVIPFQTKLGDLELLAAIEIQPKVIDRCSRCAVGDFGWPEVAFRCQRARMDSVVTVYVARTGKTLARRRFEGVAPGPCGENISHLAVRGGTSPEITPWIRENFVREP